MDKFARLYSMHESGLGKLLQILIFVSLLGLEALTVGNWHQFRIVLAILSVFLMLEVFLSCMIERQNPPVKIADNDGKNPLASFTLKAAANFVTKKTTEKIIRSLLSNPQAQFLLTKSDLTAKDMQFIDIPKKSLAAYALAVAKSVHGTFVTPIDIFAAYMLLTEDKTKLLFSKKLKKEAFMHILYWGRNTFVQEEVQKPIRIHFWGQGIGDDWCFGWTIETQKYMNDITASVLQKKQTLFGRSEEYKTLLESLSANKSVLLVGEPGVGKEALIESLSRESFLGNLKGNLSHQRLYELMVDVILAGSQSQGELEKRLDDVIAEISHAGSVIVYIPDFASILGNSSFHINLAGALIPYLEKGIIRVVGSVSLSNYKSFIETMPTLLNALTIIKMIEPDEDIILQMLFKDVALIESTKHVPLTYQAVMTALHLGKKYSQGELLPGAAVTLLQDSAGDAAMSGKKQVEAEDIENMVHRKTHIAVGIPNAEEKNTLLHLEDQMHLRLIDQTEAVHAISESMRRLRAGLIAQKKPISFLFLGPTGVGKTETAKALAKIYFGDENKMLRFDMSEYGTEEGMRRLLGALPGEAGENSGELTESVYQNPFSLILLDEFEKAHPKILNLFLQVLDDGRLTDNKGKTVSFLDTIIIATSNAGSEFIREQVAKNANIDKTFTHEILEYLETQNLFRPELLNRFDDVIVFKPIGEAEAVAITKLFLQSFQKQLLEQDVSSHFSDGVIAKIAREGFDKEFGARPLQRYLQDTIEDMIAQKILNNEIQRGNTINVSLDASGNFVLQTTT